MLCCICEFCIFAHTASPCRPYYSASAPTHPGLATLCHHITLFLSFRLASPLRPYLWARLFISAPYLWARKGEALICGHEPAAEMQMMVVSTFFLLPVVATIFPLSDFQTNPLLLILSLLHFPFRITSSKRWSETCDHMLGKYVILALDILSNPKSRNNFQES